jgi:hypothetical protein
MHIQKSSTQAQLYAALARAQSQIGVAGKDKVNPAFNSKYVDLSAVLTAVLPAWNANGLAISQFPYVSDGNEWIELTTLVSHASGEYLEHSMRMPVGGKRDAHAVGSATTYARRYSVAAIAGVIQDDDDGNLASHVDVIRAEARNIARTELPRPAPLVPAPKPAPAPAAAPVQAPAPEPVAAPVASPAPAPAPAPAPEAKPEPQPQPKGEIEDQPADPPNGMHSLNEHQLVFSVKVRSKNEINYPLFLEWALANGKGAPTDWPLSKQKQALEWIEKGGWQSVRKWQAERDARKAAATKLEEAVDKLRVEDEIQESEQAQAEAKPKRARRTKAEMEAYRASVAAGGKANIGGEE